MKMKIDQNKTKNINSDSNSNNNNNNDNSNNNNQSIHHVDADDDDEYDDDDEDGDDESHEQKQHEKNKLNLLYSLNRRQQLNRYRKTDGIKTISTPHGKVRILYETSSSSQTGSSLAASSSNSMMTPTNNNNNNHNNYIKTGEVQKDITSLSAAADLKQKISPVLINGTVALLYRGESSNTNINNSKYMPITSITNFMYNNKDNNDNSDSNSNNNNNKDNNSNLNEDTTTNEPNKNPKTIHEETTIIVLPSAAVPNNADNTINNGNDNSVLPSIDRPLSEVLGIKKNQFTLFRIADTTTTTKKTTIVTRPPKADADGNPISNYDYEDGLGGNDDDDEDDEDDDDDDEEDDDEEDASDNETIANYDIPKTTHSHSETTHQIKTELVNLAIIPSFDRELEDRTRKYYESNHINSNQISSSNAANSNKNGRYHNINDLSTIHCAMQAMVAIAAMATIFGVLGAYFKSRILDQIMIMHW